MTSCGVVRVINHILWSKAHQRAKIVVGENCENQFLNTKKGVIYNCAIVYKFFGMCGVEWVILFQLLLVQIVENNF